MRFCISELLVICFKILPYKHEYSWAQVSPILHPEGVTGHLTHVHLGSAVRDCVPPRG